jgi:hypothetical protein
MPLSLAEIKLRAIRFSQDWADASRERADSQTFWNEFFEVFGRSRKLVATFEEPVKNLKGDSEFIDLFWPGTLIAEHKSRGKPLDKANSQAIGYVHNLLNTNRGDEAPDYILLSDFARLSLHNLADESQSLEFPLADFPQHIRSFVFIAGYQSRKLDPEDPANERAVVKLAHLHDQLAAANFTGPPLERFLVRVLFCLFAEDTAIFDEPDMFKNFLLNHTKPDGSDLGSQLAQLFQILDTPRDQRPSNLSEDLAAFPHVNGALFGETLRFPIFSTAQRNALLDCARFQWAKISPAIFGALFQDVMAADTDQPDKRRQIGAHYTSERDILKLIRSLFLDDLHAEFSAAGKERRKLNALHDKLARLRFLDPACGCGNFLVITYRELRRLELDVLKAIHGTDQPGFNVGSFLRLDVDQMFGIEIEEWPARIAEVALWLLDHQMNQLASETFGQHYARLPLKASPHIHVANALRVDWNTILPAGQCSYVLGNPPFVGKKARNAQQVADIETVFHDVKGAGVLDYVACWYRRAAEYMKHTPISAAFVSTNSISQGEQPGILWPSLSRTNGFQIHFAHRTFAWMSEARGKAHVHVVIIGFGTRTTAPKPIHDYDPDPDHPTITLVSNISPYLAKGGDDVLLNRTKPLCPVPEMQFGNMPNDDGNFLLTDSEKSALVKADPAAADFIRPFLSAKEYLHGTNRWCIWLKDADPADYRRSKMILARIEKVHQYRHASKRETTKELADAPALFGEIRQPSTRFVLVPRHSSENRRYIPLSYFTPRHIVGDSCMFIPNATLFHFGILSSNMHLAWVKQVCGRLESRFRYSAGLVYNNFPWPDVIPPATRSKIETKAQTVLDTRARFLKTGSTLAQLYDGVHMPATLHTAHSALDLAVDRAYRPQPGGGFPSDRHRFEFLFALYERLSAPLTPPPKTSRKPHTK